MSVDGTAEQDAIKARIAAPGAGQLVGGRVLDSVPSEKLIPRDPESDLALNYIVLTYGSIYPSDLDRSIEGEEDQPQIMPIIAECWGPDADSVRRTAGAVRQRFIGFEPTENSTQIRLRGGGWFEQKSSAGRPELYMESVTGTTTINMQTEQP